jgi:hypothetical protein
MCCVLLAAQVRSQERNGHGGFGHTQAEIRRGRWGFLPPVLCFKFVMAGRLWAGLAAVLILVVGSQKKPKKQPNAKQKKKKEKKRHRQYCGTVL